MLTGNPERFALVIANLLENAVHHGSENGTVIVGTWSEDGKAVLRVSDDGPGIATDDLPHVFERFYRVDKARSRSGGRYGLGLAICQSLVETEKGAIAVESTPGKGVVFTATWPLI